MALTWSGVASGRAEAGTDNYCGVAIGYLAPGGSCRGPNHSLRGNAVSHNAGATSIVGAGASLPGGGAYGSIIYDSDGYVCHSYSGANVLTPIGQNGSATYSQIIDGLSYWGVDGPCP